MTGNNCWISLGKDEDVLKWTVNVIKQLCEHADNDWAEWFQPVYDLYCNKADKHTWAPIICQPFW